MSYDKNKINQTINVKIPNNDGDNASERGKINGILKQSESIVSSVANTSYKKIFKVFVSGMIFIIMAFLGVLSYEILMNKNNVDKIVSQMIDHKKDDEDNMKIRDIVSPQITAELQKALYTSRADRAVIFELHNGKENAANLPFRYADMSYEEVNDNNKEIRFSYNNFQNIPLTHYKMPYYIAEKGYFIGTLEEARIIDPRFGQLMGDTGGNYMAACVLRSEGIEVGFLCLFYDQENLPTDGKEKFKAYLSKASSIISPLLDLNIQKQRLKNVQGYAKHSNTD